MCTCYAMIGHQLTDSSLAHAYFDYLETRSGLGHTFDIEKYICRYLLNYCEFIIITLLLLLQCAQCCWRNAANAPRKSLTPANSQTLESLYWGRGETIFLPPPLQILQGQGPLDLPPDLYAYAQYRPLPAPRKKWLTLYRIDLGIENAYTFWWRVSHQGK